MPETGLHRQVDLIDVAFFQMVLNLLESLVVFGLAPVKFGRLDIGATACRLLCQQSLRIFEIKVLAGPVDAKPGQRLDARDPALPELWLKRETCLVGKKARGMKSVSLRPFHPRQCLWNLLKRLTAQDLNRVGEKPGTLCLQTIEKQNRSGG